LPEIVTITLTEPLSLPPSPLQLSVYVVSSIGETISELSESEATFVPLQPPEGGSEEAVQLVVLVEDQVRVKESPEVIVGTEDEMVTVGAGVAYEDWA